MPPLGSSRGTILVPFPVGPPGAFAGAQTTSMIMEVSRGPRGALLGSAWGPLGSLVGPRGALVLRSGPPTRTRVAPSSGPCGAL
eukprot:438449-Pyramimonas_sp.AAC.1